jgi:hypothetical protein
VTPMKALFFLPLTIWAFSGCSTGTAPSHLLVGNWGDGSRKFATMQMRLVSDARSVIGTACGTSAGYLSFRNAPVEVDGRTIHVVITKDSIVAGGSPLIGNRFLGELKDDGTIVGRMTGTGQPLNFTLVRSDLVSGTCEGDLIYTPP